MIEAQLDKRSINEQLHIDYLIEGLEKVAVQVLEVDPPKALDILTDLGKLCIFKETGNYWGDDA